MSNPRCVNVLLCSAFLWLATASAQQPITAEENPHDHSVQLNVVVTDHLTLFVTDLRQRDFAVLDDGSSRAITSFKTPPSATECFDTKSHLKVRTRRL